LSRRRSCLPGQRDTACRPCARLRTLALLFSSESGFHTLVSAKAPKVARKACRLWQGPLPVNLKRLVAVLAPQQVSPLVEAVEQRADRRVVDRLVAVVGDQILLADVGDVARLGVLGEQMVERLVLGWPHAFRNGLVPFLAVGELRIDVEDHAPKVEQPVANDLADREAREWDRR